MNDSPFRASVFFKKDLKLGVASVSFQQNKDAYLKTIQDDEEQQE
jgi:hypothetical protein